MINIMLQNLLQICNRFVTSSFEGVESLAWKKFSSSHQNTIQAGPYATQKYFKTSYCPRTQDSGADIQILMFSIPDFA